MKMCFSDITIIFIYYLKYDSLYFLFIIFIFSYFYFTGYNIWENSPRNKEYNHYKLFRKNIGKHRAADGPRYFVVVNIWF